MQVVKNEQRQNADHQHRQEQPQPSSRTPSELCEIIPRTVQRLGSHGLTFQNMLESATHKTLRQY
jgi:hypothetical protein